MIKISPISTRRFTLLLSLYFLVVMNLPMAAKLIGILETTEGFTLGMILSLPLFFGALFYLLFSCFTFKYIAKPVAVMLVLISSLVSYTMYYYGTIFNMDMIRNIVETNSSEAGSYVNAHAALWWLVTGVVPSLLIVLTPLKWQSLPRELLGKTVSVVAAIAVIGGIAGLYYKDYASLGRNNPYLAKMIVPTYYLYSAGKFVNRTYIEPPRAYTPIGTDAQISDTETRDKPRLVVMVVGETARAKNFELNGYSRPTNEFTRSQDVISFQNVQSCGTATAISIPCMFSRLDRQDYDAELAKTQDNLIDVIKRAGVNVRWLENDGGCKGVCNNVPTLAFDNGLDRPECAGEYCHDEVLLTQVEQELAEMEGQDALLVLHLVGSHGPTYYQRYPDQFRKFAPDCPRSDIQNCTDLEIVNTYDNTLYYSDFILGQLIETLKTKPQWQTSLLYVSDHGESLGENGLYLHGMPYALAPVEQTHVPMLLWMSPEYSEALGYDRSCVSNRAQQEQFSHDNLFDSLLGMMQVRTELYRPEHDIFSLCQQGSGLDA